MLANLLSSLFILIDGIDKINFFPVGNQRVSNQSPNKCSRFRFTLTFALKHR